MTSTGSGTLSGTGPSPYHRDAASEVCSSGGARPVDHPLCESCEQELKALVSPACCLT